MYAVDFWGDDVAASLTALPAHLLVPFAELRAALELSPWTVGRPFRGTNPTGSRTATFGPDGEGHVAFMIRETDAQVVTILQVFWL